jgi:hypothetical protein
MQEDGSFKTQTWKETTLGGKEVWINLVGDCRFLEKKIFARQESKHNVAPSLKAEVLLIFQNTAGGTMRPSTWVVQNRNPIDLRPIWSYRREHLIFSQDF